MLKYKICYFKFYRYGADIAFRKQFEKYLAEKQALYCGGLHRIPIVCLALEGDICTLDLIHEYLTRPIYPIPVLICEGSGQISDILALAERYLNYDKFVYIKYLICCF